MNELEVQCNAATSYPKNLSTEDSFPHVNVLKHDFLDKEEKLLFCREGKALIDFLEFGDEALDFWDYQITSATELRKHYGIGDANKIRDPLCRYLFLSAKTSRDPLYCTREMLALSFTYLQVPLDFIEFLSLFGRQSRPKHFYFSAFRQRTRLCSVVNPGQKPTPGLRIDSIGWSGRDISVCYNLKSVESSPQQWPWSIRDCAVSHFFDLEFSRSTWIIIKGDNVIRDRIRLAAKSKRPSGLASLQALDRAFAATLLNHLLICGWAKEGWGSYTFFLDARYHEISKKAVSNDLELPLVVRPENGDTFAQPKRSGTGVSIKSIKTGLSRARTRTFSALGNIEKKSSTPGSHDNPDLEVGHDQRFSPGIQKVAVEFETRGQESFSLDDLQRLQNLQDKASEAVLVLKLNLSVMAQMRQYYRSITSSPDFPSSIAISCTRDLDMFKSAVKGYEDDIQMSVMKLDTLIGSIRECKALLQGVLDWQNKEANKYLASQSSVSTVNMERMAWEMNGLARKTKTETVSMKVITLVTLAFLPGTYISTLMSTDIFQGQDNSPGSSGPYGRLSPWQFYLALTMPLTFCTLMIWLIASRREKSKAETKQRNYYAQGVESPPRS